MKVTVFTDNNPDYVHNEDRAGYKENIFWVIDGATSLSETKILPGGKTDAEAFADMLDLGFQKHLNSDEPLKSGVGRALDEIILAMDKSALKTIKPYEQPSAQAIIIKLLSPSEIEYYVIGDCSALVKNKNGRIHPIKNTEMEELGENMKKPFIKEWLKCETIGEYRDRTLALTQNHRSLMNSPVGFHTLTIDKAGYNQALVGRICGVDIDQILLFSDGFERLLSGFSMYTVEELMNTSKSLDQMTRELRVRETEDNNVREYRRFKVYDDVSVIKIENI